MKAVLFGATGMIGQAALRECLRDPEVMEVLSIARRPTGARDPKLRVGRHERGRLPPRDVRRRAGGRHPYSRGSLRKS
jgi:uncharacterized protein YbjT (DUF2867 family)